MFDTQLHLAGVSTLAVQKLMRRKDLKLTTNTYFDAGQLKLQGDIEKLPSPLSVSLYVSHKSGKNSPNVSGFENKDFSAKKNIDLKDLDLEQVRALLAKVVRKCPDAEMVLRGGLEPPCAVSQDIDSQSGSESGDKSVSASVSQESEKLCQELAEIVRIWPKLDPPLREMVRWILRL